MQMQSSLPTTWYDLLFWHCLKKSTETVKEIIKRGNYADKLNHEVLIYLLLRCMKLESVI